MPQKTKHRTTHIARHILVWLMGASLVACAETKTLEAGASTMFILETDTGKLRWGVSFQGETLRIAGLQNGNNTVVVALSDACWDDAPRQYAFQVSDGSPSDIDGSPLTETDDASEGVDADDDGEATAYCDLAVQAHPEVSDWQPLGTVCIALDTDANKPQQPHRLTVADPDTGALLWTHQQAEPMTGIGADDDRVYLLSQLPFALKRNNGQQVWTTDHKYVPQGGVLKGGNLFFFQQIYASPCQAEAP
ncbi:MAG: PQQ-binding-like beta-propeller repeat protein [Myxococcales bacterium]|jgi:outer membrane protein assembly factor BamB|nr:PQQ-binding-like beta-propeller repeat protein [Myxococcales bacterium]